MGDRALLVELGEGVNPPVNRRVREIFLGLERRPMKGIMEVVPSYRSLMFVFDPLTISRITLERRIREDWEKANSTVIAEPRTREVPVVYGGEFGPDLEWVARYHNITPEDVVRLHTGTAYQVYMIGFAPGFPYMGELPEALATPRRETPRLAVPRGSVAIAQRQTGIYPVQSPGGWQILGRTPLRLFDASRWPPTPLETGDMVRFIAVEKGEVPAWPS
ncbi:MAG: 5-oxoprolinase subunit PxpB [Deltaproteobacteria bacterium]|nr:5-oxoprolinase subunit PxpB [Deltaproteobacteria bacterium]